MGKDKSGQRTKGNAKPSSSGRSAELLGGVAGFVGFGGLSDLGYVPAATQANVDDDSQISAEFRVTLRKMSKKDSVTKIKALQEFENLCTSEDIESVKIALPYWPRLYSKLSIDCDRRVRESTQTSHSTLVSQVGKNLAPYLRSVMPSWILAMTDPHSPAAITATKSFQSAFSEDKRPGVMIFCSKEIIAHIHDNLFIQSSQTLSDPKSTEKEDQESKYVRVLFCSLKALSLLLESTLKLVEKKGEILAKVIPLIEEEKFWKLAKHETTLVRSAWFSAIKSIFEFDVEPLKPHSQKLSRIILGSLDSPDAAVLPYIWIAFLHLCVGLPECWDLCESPKSVFNRMFSVLRDGGRGFMCDISPQLLPILSVIPQRVMPDSTTFYVDFFRALSSSLYKDKVLKCKRDVTAIIVALNECLKYMSKEHGSNVELWNTLMKYQVVDLVCSSFAEYPQLADSHLHQEVGKLLFYWASSVSSSGANCNMEKLENFWEQFLPECISWVTEGDQSKLLKLKQFFIMIKDPHANVGKLYKGVRFADDKIDNGNNSNDTDVVLSSKRDEYVKIISKFVSRLTKHSFETYRETGLEVVYALFSNLLFSYSSEQIYFDIIDQRLDDLNAAKYMFLEDYILPFMEEGNKEAPLSTSIDLFLYVYEDLPQHDQRRLLSNLKPTLRVSALRALVGKMAERSETDAVAASWLKSPPLGSRLVKCLQQLLFAKDSKESDVVIAQYEGLKDLISFVLNNGFRQNIVFSLEYQSQMVKMLKTILLQQIEDKSLSGEEDLNHSEFILLLTTLLNHLLDSSIHSKVDGLEDIVKQFYLMLCNPPPISEEALSQLKECFLKALKLNLCENMPDNPEELYKEEQSLISYVITQTKIAVMEETCSYARTAELSDLLERVLIIMLEVSSLEDSSLLLDHSFVQPTLNKLLPTDLEWGQMEVKLSPLYVVPCVLNGMLMCREFPLPSKPNELLQWDQQYVRVCSFVVNVLLSLSKSPESLENDEDSGKEVDGGRISLGQYLPLAVIALHGVCHSSAMVHMNSFLNNNSVPPDVKRGSERFATDMKKLLCQINVGNKRLIVKHLRDRCSYGNICWCVTFTSALNSWLDVSIPASKLINELNDNFVGFTETKQMLLRYLPQVEVLKILNEETEKLSQLSEDPFSALPSICFITSALQQLVQSSQEMKKGSEAHIQLEKAIHTIFNVLVKWRDTANNIFLFASDLSGVPWEEVTIMVSIIRLLSVIVKGYSLYLLHSHWDIALCSLSAWVQSLVEVSQYPESNTVVAMFATACSKCAAVVSDLLAEIKGNQTLREEYPPTLVEEWQEFFAPSIFNTVLLKFIQCSNVYNKERSIILYMLVRSLSLSVSTIQNKVIKELTLPPLFNTEDEENQLKLPENLQVLVNHLGPLLLSSHPNCQCAAYTVLKTSLFEIMTAWEKNSASVSEESEEDWPQRSLPHTLINVINEAGPIVETALEDKSMGHMVEIIPYTDTFTYTNGYLLTWFLVLCAVTHGEENNQQLYASYLRESGLLFKLLNIIFKLMPPTPTFETDKNPGDAKAEATMFNTQITVSALSKVSSEFISWLACQIYLSCLSQLPAAVRNWWTNLDRNSQQLVDKFTATYASPILIANEINAINDSTVKYNNMVVKSRPGAREIIATYTIDEASMELVLRLAPNHPLSTVTLDDHKRVGVSISQWRNWLFGLNTMLSHRNTPLLNSLEFWKKNVDQKFEGIEECFICYYVLHGTSHQIPKLLCRTCKKKFHSACLYKWFSTSSNSTCPICRSLF